MKSPRFYSPRRSGFTLVELLVVIAIIAILASVLLVGIGSAMNTAKRMKASTMANQIMTAVQNFDTEYSVYPAPEGTTTDTYYASTDQVNWGKMIKTLYGNIDPLHPAGGILSGGQVLADSSGNPVNSRNIAYLSINRGDLDSTTGIVKTPFTDPDHGGSEYFFMAIDTDYSNVTGDSGAAQGVIPDFSTATIGKSVPMTAAPATGVAVWSNCDQSLNSASPNPNFWVHTY